MNPLQMFKERERYLERKRWRNPFLFCSWKCSSSFVKFDALVDGHEEFDLTHYRPC
jgi:hypothetical protein